jgi:RNA polymerase sigma factor (sigma-70 family)
MASRQLTAFLHRLREAALRQEGVEISDGELLDAFIVQRDEAAFEALVRLHGPMVLSVCQRILGNVADAEDAFQATFLVLVRKAGSIRPRGMVGNWLYGVAQNTARHAKAIIARRQQKEREAAAMRKPTTPEEAGTDLKAWLDQELPALPDKYRAPIVLCDLEGKTIREAAQRLSWPQGTVATRLTRGRALLARRLARHGLFLTGAALPLALASGSAPASVPTCLIVSTVQAGTAVAAGQATAAGLISAKVAALADGMMKAMLLKKLKALGGVLLAIALLTGSGAMFARGVLKAEPNATTKVEAERAKSENNAARSTRVEGSVQGSSDARAGASVVAGAVRRADRDALQGTRVGVSGESEGRTLPKQKLWKLVIKGDKATLFLEEPGQMREGVFTLDPDHEPKKIDMTSFDGFTLKGIYELKGDTLKTLWRENDRKGLTAEFDSKNGMLMLFEKKK